jgi:hypothetical protein
MDQVVEAAAQQRRFQGMQVLKYLLYWYKKVKILTPARAAAAEYLHSVKAALFVPVEQVNFVPVKQVNFVQVKQVNLKAAQHGFQGMQALSFSGYKSTCFTGTKVQIFW